MMALLRPYAGVRYSPEYIARTERNPRHQLVLLVVGYQANIREV
jgi:hypothetical protein